MKNIIKYKGITLDDAIESVKEILGQYGACEVDEESNVVTAMFYEFSNLFQTSEIYEVMCNGGSYEEEYEYKNDSSLKAYINFMFHEEEKELEIYSWHELTHDFKFMDEIQWDIDSEHREEIVNKIVQQKYFEKAEK